MYDRRPFKPDEERDDCTLCEHYEPRWFCWIGKPENPPCPLGYPARWEPENQRGF